LEKCRRLGCISPCTFSSYGVKHPTLPDKVIDRNRLTKVLTFMDSAVGLSHEQLLELRMPYEWLMFFRFESPAQSNSFFDRYRHLHDIVMNSACTLANDCNLIGLSAHHCKLPVTTLPKVSGIRHKQ